MADVDTDTYDDEELEEDGPKGLREAHRRAEKRAEEAEAKAAALERKSAFLEAGIPNTPKFSYFREGYKGEMTAEAIKAAAVEAELLAAPGPDVPADELAQHDRVAQAAAGAEAAPNGQQPKIGSPEYIVELGKANTEAEVKAVMEKYGSPLAEG